jgi:hypothetical protein
MIHAGVAAWATVFLVGFMIGLSELVARYRDDPWKAVWNNPALGYMFVNAVAAVATFFCLLVIAPQWVEVDQGGSELTIKGSLLAVLAASIGSAGILRSAFFKLKIDNADVSIGFAAIVDIFLAATDRAVDRKRAGPRAEAIAQIMKDVSFQKAQSALPAYCFALMQNVPGDEQKRFGDQVNALARDAMDDRIKASNLGLALMNVVGQAVLEQAVTNLLPHIASDPPFEEGRIALIAALMENVDFVKGVVLLPTYCATLRADIAPETLAALQTKLEMIAKGSLADKVKSLSLGLELSNVFGFPAVKVAIEKLGAQIAA